MKPDFCSLLCNSSDFVMVKGQCAANGGKAHVYFKVSKYCNSCIKSVCMLFS